MNRSRHVPHPIVSRRTAVQAGALGLLGLGINHMEALRTETPPAGPEGRAVKSWSNFSSPAA